MNIKKVLILITFYIGFISSSIGQTNGISPYSKVGIGDVANPFTNNIRNMGGTGISFVSPYIINMANPATYSYLKTTSFEFGMYAKSAQLEDDENKSNVWSGNINNISLAFPLRNPINDVLDRTKKDYSLGMAFSLMPHTLIGYSTSSEEETPGIGKYTRLYSGKGGTYEFLWGNSIQYKNVSFGLNLGYLFGNIVQSNNTYFTDVGFPYNNFFTTDYSLSGFLWNIGLLYTLELNKNKKEEVNKSKINKFVFGLTFKPKTGFSTKADFSKIAVQTGSGDRDTLSIAIDEKGNGALPTSLGFGVNYYNGNKWTIGLNYTFSNWSEYYNDANPDKLTDSYRISLGGYYRPNPKSYSNYFKRVYYQFGTYYQKDPISVGDGSNNKQVDSYGISLGLGLPYIYKRKISHANIGFDFGVKGLQTQLKEKYIRINFGFTFNDDEWFIKRKYN